MIKTKQILEKVLNGIDLDVSEILYLQQHQKEVKETHNIKLPALCHAADADHHAGTNHQLES